jgi:integrase
MASVRKRRWRSNGEVKEAWVADYKEQLGKRHLKTFARKKDADAFLVKVCQEVAQGIHTAEHGSITVAEAGQLWISRCKLKGLEQWTVSRYQRNLDLYISPLLGPVKLARLTSPKVEWFCEELLKNGAPAKAERQQRPCSLVMAKEVLQSLKMSLNDAVRRGCVAQNVARVAKIDLNARETPPLSVGVDIPLKEEIRRFIARTQGHFHALVVTAALTGLRPSELRGLLWVDVDLEDQKVLHVRRRASPLSRLGPPKSKAGYRTIVLCPLVVRVLKEWRLLCPRKGGELWLVFPDDAGEISDPKTKRNLFYAAEVAAGLTDEAGEAKYGLNSLRHFFASWLIERGFTLKKLQVFMGHSSIKITYDTYGHLFPSLEDDHGKFAEGERLIIDGRATEVRQAPPKPAEDLD